MTRGDQRRSVIHDHRHRGGHRHSAETYPHTFSDSLNHSDSVGGSGGGGGPEGIDGFGGGHSHSLGGHDHGGPSAAMDATFVWKLSKLGRIGSSRLRFDDDFADRLNYQYSGVLMFLFIGLIGIRQYVGKPIQCWIPQEFTRGWEEYAENYCWVSNTYFAPIQNRLPPAPDREMLLIGYYQWAPIVMAIQALAFYMPCLIWRLFMTQSGFNVRRILQMACDSNILLPEHTMKNVRFIARYMEGCIYRQRDYRRNKSAYNFAYSPLSYTGFGQQAHRIHPHLHPKMSTNRHHHMHSTPYSVAHHAPPMYSTATGSAGFNQVTSPDEDSSHVRGNGNTTHFGANSSTGRRPTANSLFDRIRLRFSLSSEILKNKKHRSGGEYSTEADEHPMLNTQKAESSPISCSNPPTCRSNENGGTGWGCCGKKHGNFLVVLYFFVKLLYLANIVGQMFIMEKFVGNNYTFYGLRVLLDLIRGHEWYHSGNFPRVTFCDFEAKKLGKNHKYTLQCVLPLNMFLEKIYIFLWFWHCIVGVITLGSFVLWFYRMGFSRRRVKFIRKYLKIMSVLKETDKAASNKFVENYLRPDGVFLIRLVSINVGDIMAGDLACELWHIYRHKRLHEIEEQKLMDTAAGLTELALTETGGTDFALTTINQTADKSYHTPTAPLLPGSINTNNSNNNDDSIV